ncbi:MAG: hypothetical protein ACOZQL_25990 [Myxococcota bacterium]
MKLVAAAILAIFALSACGVGADETWDGANYVTANGQALEGAGQNTTPAAVPTAVPTLPTPQVPAATTTSPGRDPSLVALPQDPIPVFEGRPATQPAVVDPLLGPAPRPTLR